MLLGLLLALACGVLGHRLWQAHADDWKPLPGDVTRAGPCTVWFVGSSSFGYWDSLGADMRPWQAINRGVPGASLSRLLARWQRQGRFARPPAIVVYGGENDIDHGIDPDRVAENYAALVHSLSAAMPSARIIVMAVKPSPTRWPERAEQMRLNDANQRLARENPNIRYLDANGQLMSHGIFGAYYWDDGVHLNKAGHEMWAKLIKGELVRDVPGAGGSCRN